MQPLLLIISNGIYEFVLLCVVSAGCGSSPAALNAAQCQEVTQAEETWVA